MKKNYLKPEIFSLNFVSESIIATSPGGTDVPEGEDNKPNETNKHRGEWGNVWGK